jgi:agmatine deiminase
MSETKSPTERGFYMPAEWEPHRATWLVWPQNRLDWPGKFASIRWVYAEFIRHLHQHEKICILVDNKMVKGRAKRVLRRSGIALEQIEFYLVPTDRSWIRDFGPTFLIGPASSGEADAQELLLCNWGFNGWAKYDNWKQDNRVPIRLAEHLKQPIYTPQIPVSGKPQQMILEGGSIEVNGQGTLLTTEECLLSAVQQRNPGVDRATLEEILQRTLGVQKILWLDRGIAGDDTHGHIDDLARFVGPSTVVTVLCDDRNDVNYEPLKANLERLQAMTDQDNRPLKVITLPMPAPIYLDGQRLPASYANFYLANHLVLVPTFNDPQDRVALDRLAELFPDRQVIGIHSGDLVWGLGTLHCMTQQEPALNGLPEPMGSR